jgi:hypothetical protein
MATILKCDTCDALSPDKTGLHVANRWTVLVVRTKSRILSEKKTEYLICTDCLSKGIRLNEKRVSP